MMYLAMAGMTPNLFKWNRQTNSKTQDYSKGDVQDWIKRVERASTEAAREVFGRNYQNVLEQVHVDDDALSEAQDLLESWMHEKTLEDFNLEVQFKDEKWAQVSSPFSRSASTKDLFLDDSFDEIVNLSGDQFLRPQTCTGNTSQSSLSPNIMGAEYDDELNDEISVREILQEMLDKKVVKKDILNDLGFDKSKQREDPRTTMELRHQQVLTSQIQLPTKKVKAQCKARQKELEKRRREKAACKQAEAEARKQLLREEKEREAQIKREEEAIQKEMTKIRRAMEQEKKAAKEKFERDLHKSQMAEILAQQYLEQEQRLKKEQEINDIEEKEKIRNMLLEQMEKKAAEKTRKNLRTLQKYFSMWYSVAAVQHIKLGKAQALSDWRSKLHSWNAWRAYVNHMKSDKEAQAVANEMKEKHRKEQLSLKFYRQHQLLRCLRAWQLWVRREQEQRQLQEEHNRKTKKMAALLEAAATGRLWSKQAGDTLSLQLEDIEDDTEIGSRISTARKVDEIFAQPVRKIPSKHPLVSETNLVAESSTKMANGNRPATYKQAWIGKDQSISTEWTEQLKKATRSERAINVKSQRQHSYSEEDQVESLYPNSTNNRLKREKKKDTSASANSLNRPQVQETLVKEEKKTGVLTEQSMSPGPVGNQMAATPTKVNSRESPIKTKKLVTKPLHLAMEERAKERKNRKAVLEEKKRKAEEEKLAFLKMEQERKETELLAEKQEALRKRKEEKRLARERELEKQRQFEHSRQQTTLAERHYATVLLKKYGMLPWKSLVLMTRDNMSCAVLHSNLVALRACFYPWLELTRQVREERNKAADMLYSGILLRRTWRQWKKYGQHAVRLQMVAEDYRSSYLQGKYFKCWQDYVTEEQIMLWQKEKRADEHNEWRLMKLAMIQWKKYIPLMRSEREKQARREELRKRVHSWLPDFQASSRSSP